MSDFFLKKNNYFCDCYFQLLFTLQHMLALTKNIHKIHFYITANSNVQNNFNHHLKKILTLKML